MMHDGLGMDTGLPTGVRSPVCASILNTTMLLPGMLAHSNHSPPGVMARFCGPWPRLGSISTSASGPSSPMRYTAMLSCPRLVP